jgi:hypothetical protein
MIDKSQIDIRPMELLPNSDTVLMFERQAAIAANRMLAVRAVNL